MKTLSIYDNERSQIYPELSSKALQKPQAYRLKKLTEMDPYLLDETEVRDRLTKKMK